MKKTLLLLLILLPLAAAAAEAESLAPPPPPSAPLRIGVEFTTWQELLRLQRVNGETEASVANYKGFLVTLEKQWREGTSAWALCALAGNGQSSGGGTSPAFAFQQGSTTWNLGAIEPRYLWFLSEAIDLGIGAALVYRSVEWGTSPSITVTPANAFSATVFFDFDCRLSPRWFLRQSFGLNSADVGPFIRWGLDYEI